MAKAVLIFPLLAKDAILKAYDEHDTLIIIGETGSGKTTRKNPSKEESLFTL